ncbi:hypothetical protein ACUN0C_12295 [Faunimonas sp. B44]|uniref:hypothetical protein n=1 Tax=Faunimonas sp. B44 TaxID=3461493 RepID=UPI0040446064
MTAEKEAVVAAQPDRPRRAGDMLPPPDYEAVMADEFRHAREAGTNAALIRFIARHPQHRLADEARALLSRRPAADPPGGTGDPDADVYRAFDQARRDRAFDSFIARHPQHPLAEEARRMMRTAPEAK